MSPRDAAVATPWTALTAGMPCTLVCCRIDDLPLGPHGRIWERALAQIVLGRAERDAWSRLPGSAQERTEWLVGRVAAKDAVRALLRTTSGATLCPADIGIIEQPDGGTVVTGPWTGQPPIVSLAQRDGATVAVAGHCHAIGIALGDLSADDPARSRAHPLVGALDEPLRAEWARRVRCAEEAAAALGGTPADLLDLDTVTGIVRLAGGSERVPVQTVRDGDRIAALAVR